MKILVLESSGNKHGSSNLLAREFIRGASEAGHEVTEFDVTRADIRPCLGCNHCGMNVSCVQKDDYENKLKALIHGTDMIVFAFPVYYYNWPAQIKAVVDRFYSFTGELTSMHKKTAMLTVAWDATDSTFDPFNPLKQQLILGHRIILIAQMDIEGLVRFVAAAQEESTWPSTFSKIGISDLLQIYCNIQQRRILIRTNQYVDDRF